MLQHILYSTVFSFWNTIILCILSFMVISLIAITLLLFRKFNGLIKTSKEQEDLLCKRQSKIIQNVRQFYNDMPVGVITYDKNGRVEFVNEKLVEICHFSADDAVMKGEYNLFDSKVLTNEEKEALKAGKDLDLEININLRDGETSDFLGKRIDFKILIRCKFRSFEDIDNSVTQHVMIAEDLTQELSRNSEVQSLHKLLALGMKKSSFVLSYFDTSDDTYYYLTENGFEKSEYKIKDIVNLVDPLDRARYNELLLNAKSGAITFASGVFKTYNIVDKEYQYVECTTSVIIDEKTGRVSKVLQALKNVTNIKLNLLDMRNRQNKFNSVLKATKFNIWEYNASSKELKSILFDNFSLNGKDILDKVHPDDYKKFSKDWFGMIEGKIDEVFFVIRSRFLESTDYRYLEIFAKSVQDTKTDARIIIGVTHDVTNIYSKSAEYERYRNHNEAINEFENSTLWDYEIATDKVNIESDLRYGITNVSLNAIIRYLQPSNVDEITKVSELMKQAKVTDPIGLLVKARLGDLKEDNEIQISIIPSFNSDGSIIGYYGLAHNVSSMKQLVDYGNTYSE